MSRISKSKKYFSLQEANKALVLVSPIVKDVLETINKLALFKQIVESGDSELDDEQSQEIQNLQFKLIHYLNELKTIGVYISDLHLGMVDFPMLKDEKESYFCWKYGEAEICFYRDSHTDPSKRKYLYNITQNHPS
jgi:hypothetical protein